MVFDFETMFADGIPDGGRQVPLRRGKYDFAVAYPDPMSFPKGQVLECLAEALEESAADLAVYPHPQGNTPLREYVSEKLSRDRDIDVPVEDIVLGNGSGHPIDMVCQVLVEKGDVVITDQYVYGGTLNTLRRNGADIRWAKADDGGMDPEALDSAISKSIQESRKPKFVYLIATFQNPQGFTLSEQRRSELLSVTQKYGVPILEDDCYADNRYDGENVTSIHNLDEGNNVIYVGSFSKVIAPGMSLGYLTAPPQVLDKVMGVRSARISEFTAMAVERYARKYLDSHIESINKIQRVKRDSMLSALGENFGTSAKWSSPDGGLYIWMELDEKVDVQGLNEKALDQIDVGFHPGTNYSPDGKSGKNYIRLCYGYNQPDEITEGISRLANFFSEAGAINI